MQLTKEYVREKYGKVPLKFSSYYKYSFSFKGTAEDGADIYASYGGDHNDIYRWDVSADKEMRLEDEEFNGDSVLSYLTIKKDDEELFKYSSY